MEAASKIVCLLVPLSQLQLALPASTTVEVYRGVVRGGWRRGDDAWWLNETPWRGQVLPVVALEPPETSMNQSTKPTQTRVIIMRSLLTKTEPRIYAISVHDIPRLLELDASNTSAVADPGEPHPLAGAYLRINGTLAMVPDLERLEGELTQALRQQKAQREGQSKLE